MISFIQVHQGTTTNRKILVNLTKKCMSYFTQSEAIFMIIDFIDQVITKTLALALFDNLHILMRIYNVLQMAIINKAQLRKIKFRYL